MSEKKEENTEQSNLHKEVTNKEHGLIIENRDNFGKKVDLTKNSMRKICLDICDKFKISHF